MTNIREVLAANLKKYRQARGWSQAKLAEKTGTSTQYIGMLEIKGKFPSSQMIQKLAAALCIDPTKLFFKEIDPEIIIKNSQKAAIEDVSEAVNHLLADLFAQKIQQYSTDTRQMPPEEPEESDGQPQKPV
jgi:transcriptional regulator with XRE-family HTH domain